MGSVSGAAKAPAPPPSVARLLIRYGVMALVLALLFRVLSGRSDWSRAWIYTALVVAAQSVTGLALRHARPDLIAERSRIREGTKSWDRVLMPAVAIVGPAAVWSAAAADVRAHWPPPVPIDWSIAAFGVCLLGCGIVFGAMWTNAFFATTVRIQTERGHAVVDTGPYARIRHPGYAGALAFTIATPVALGSWIALYPALLTCIALALRTLMEDRTLRAELPGYEAYAGRVRWRLLPGLW